MPSSAKAREFHLRSFFSGIDIAGRTILDIGCGAGSTAIYALRHGAKYIIGLEPEAAGSTRGVTQRVRGLRETSFQALPLTIQEYNSGGLKFDIVVLHDSINHLDEESCIRLRTSSKCWKNYVQIMGKVNSMMNSGGRLVIADISRRNLFADLGMKNPLSPSIEWHKHQTPETWAKLLGECGFVEPWISWLTPGPLRVFNPIIQYKWVSYFLISYFRLVMEKK